jgi:hypothetical protein
VTGQYYGMAKSPTGCTTGGTTQVVWDLVALNNAKSIDWVIEGKTYGCYGTAVPAAPAINLAIGASSDIDGDATASCVALYKTASSTVTDAPNAPCNTARAAVATDPIGSVIRGTGDNVF